MKHNIITQLSIETASRDFNQKHEQIIYLEYLLSKWALNRRNIPHHYILDFNEHVLHFVRDENAPDFVFIKLKVMLERIFKKDVRKQQQAEALKERQTRQTKQFYRKMLRKLQGGK